ncbi:MAG: ammonia-forming cytochrome c nitrite reductase subunit c552 [Rhodobacterales bacterium]|nr:ammonia-forming cytochrome c nitrite reductase subunit c552 [Rhodobacterales bacterium]
MNSLLLFLAGCGAAPATVDAPTPPSPWAGSESCTECHPSAYQAWSTSHHHLAQRTANNSDLPFDGLPSLTLDPRQPAVPLIGLIGVAPLVQGLVAQPGRIQATPVAWDVEKREWFGVFPDVRQPGDWGHWTGGGLTWNSQCATCHNTEVIIGFDVATEQYNTQVEERGVGCEACHGPAGEHVQSGVKLPSIQQDVNHCAACHSRRLAHADGAPVGAAFLDHFTPQIPDLSADYWPDGQVRSEDFEWSSFAGTSKHDAGVTCGSCHDAHSGALRTTGDALCQDCHKDTPDHDHHGGDVSCVDCHMPQTTYMERHPRRDHSFSVPNPLLTEKLGIPNACNRCHTDQDAAWASDALSIWGQNPAAHPSTARATALHAARQRQADTAQLLDAALTLERQPQWRASLLRSMADVALEPTILDHLTVASRHEDAQIRQAAAFSLPYGHPIRDTLARDAIRAVRIEAQRGLMRQRPPSHPSMADLRKLLDSQLDQPAQVLVLASWQVAHQDIRGLDGLRRAVNRWPQEAAAHLQLAVALAMTGDAAAARAVLEAAVLLHPGSADLWDALAKARNPDGDVKGARDALEKAVLLNPRMARSWVNLSKLRAHFGDAAGAEQALKTCRDVQPMDCQ